MKIKLLLKRVKRFIIEKWWVILLMIVIISVLITAGITVYQFRIKFYNSEISNNPQDWGVFGDYFGGVLNPLLSLINICVTIWITILINKYSNQNTEKQIEAERKVAKIQLKHEALRELRTELNQKMKLLIEEDDKVYFIKECNRILSEFEENYSYLFDLKNISSYKSLLNTLKDLVIIVVNHRQNEYYTHILQIDSERQKLLSELGQDVLA